MIKIGVGEQWTPVPRQHWEIPRYGNWVLAMNFRERSWKVMLIAMAVSLSMSSKVFSRLPRLSSAGWLLAFLSSGQDFVHKLHKAIDPSGRDEYPLHSFSDRYQGRVVLQSTSREICASNEGYRRGNEATIHRVWVYRLPSIPCRPIWCNWCLVWADGTRKSSNTLMDRISNSRLRVSATLAKRDCPRCSDQSSPTAKYWLYFLKGYPSRQNPEPLPKTISKYVFLKRVALSLGLIFRWDCIQTALRNGTSWRNGFLNQIRITLLFQIDQVLLTSHFSPSQFRGCSHSSALTLRTGRMYRLGAIGWWLDVQFEK